MANARKSATRGGDTAGRTTRSRSKASAEGSTVLPPQSPNDRKSAESVFRGVAGQAPEAQFPDEAVAAAEDARPDLPDENEDGLDELTQEIQRQAGRGPSEVDADDDDEDPDTIEEEGKR